MPEARPSPLTAVSAPLPLSPMTISTAADTGLSSYPGLVSTRPAFAVTLMRSVPGRSGTPNDPLIVDPTRVPPAVPASGMACW